MSEFLEVRCGANRFLVLSEDIDSIEVLAGVPEPFGGGRAPRAPLLLDGRVLAGNDVGGAPKHRVTLRVAERLPLETRIVVDQVGALIRCDPAAIEPLPHAVARLRTCFSGVWREQASQEYLFCVRPRRELALERFAWRRRLRQAAMAIRPVVGERTST
ncbi:MAG TPA: hypothetical protein VII39_04935 [Bradyrhizobium sp.]